MTILISIDREWAGFYTYRGHGLRLVLGFIAITVLPMSEDEMFSQAILHCEKLKENSDA